LDDDLKEFEQAINESVQSVSENVLKKFFTGFNKKDYEKSFSYAFRLSKGTAQALKKKLFINEENCDGWANPYLQKLAGKIPEYNPMLGVID
jgi:hypothetical protein